MAYLISYDLRSPGKSYDELYSAIKKLGDWWHHLDSVWIVDHPGPSTTIRDLLTPYIDSNDKLVVIKCSGEGAWKGITQSGSDWLKRNL